MRLCSKIISNVRIIWRESILTCGEPDKTNNICLFLVFPFGYWKKNISMFKLGIINSERWCWEVKAQDEGEVEDLKKMKKNYSNHGMRGKAGTIWLREGVNPDIKESISANSFFGWFSGRRGCVCCLSSAFSSQISNMTKKSWSLVGLCVMQLQMLPNIFISKAMETT